MEKTEKKQGRTAMRSLGYNPPLNNFFHESLAMPYNSDSHRRQSRRLKGYDYTQGGIYFITICAYQRESLFGAVTDAEMWLNTLGCVIDEEWLRTPQIRPGIILDKYVIMPNHFHAIVWFQYDHEGGTHRRGA